MKVDVKNEIPEIDVNVRKTDDGGISILVTKKAKKPLGSFKRGSVVKIGEREYIVLDHGSETTAVIAKDFVKSMEFGKDGDYIQSNVRKYCEGEFYEELAKAVGKENVVEHAVKLMADNGTGKGIAIKANVSILTTELYRRYREFLPETDKWEWTATRVSDNGGPVFSRYVCGVLSGGILSWDDCGCIGGVRPYCILRSSIPFPVS